MTAHRRDVAFRTWTRSAATLLGLVSLVVAAPAAAFADASPPADETTTPTPTQTAPAEDTTDAEETETPEATDTGAPAEETESPAPAETTPPPTNPAAAFISFDLVGYVDDASVGSPSGTKLDGSSSVGEGPHEVAADRTVPISLTATNTGEDPLTRLSVRDGSGAVVYDQSFGEEGIPTGDSFTMVIDGPTPAMGETSVLSYTVFGAGLDGAVSETFSPTLVGRTAIPAITATSYVDDVEPLHPVGRTYDGQDSTGPVTLTSEKDVPVVIGITNTGDEPISRVTITDAAGTVVADDEFVIDGVAQFLPGSQWLYSTTLTADVIGDGYSNDYTVTAFTEAGEATATTGVRILTKWEGASLAMSLYANDANPSAPTGRTAGGADSSTDGGPLAVPAGEDVTLSFVVTNTGSVAFDTLTIGGKASEDILIDVVLDEPLQPGETYIGTATLKHRMFDETITSGEVYHRDYSVAGTTGTWDEPDWRHAYAYDHLQLVQAAPGNANSASSDGGSLAATGTDSAGLLMGTTAVALLIGAAGITLLARRRQSSDLDG